MRKYSGLVRNSLKDSSEIDTVVTEPTVVVIVFAPEHLTGILEKLGCLGTPPGTASIDSARGILATKWTTKASSYPGIDGRHG